MIYELGQANRLGNRHTNQDRFRAIETDEGVLLVLGDGMGGQARGEVAAQILIDIAEQHYLEATRPIDDARGFLANILRSAHLAIIEYGQKQTPVSTPGTTAVLCLLQQNRAVWAHVGDSRCYLFQNGLPLYRTTDHSFVELLYQKGAISRREQESHPQRNQITQCLGGGLQEALQPAISQPVTLHQDDVILLCSDGLWGPLDDALMGKMLCQPGSLDDVINDMAEQAERLSYPHSDNISALALKMLSTRTVRTKDDSAQVTQGPAGDDPLQSAIAEIEAVIKQYEGELKK